MPSEMYEGAVKKLYQRDGRKSWQWKVVPVASIASTPEAGGIRCQHCRGHVRVHKRRVPHGPADHVEHLSTVDSTNCLGGHIFAGVHKISDHPVE